MTEFDHPLADAGTLAVHAPRRSAIASTEHAWARRYRMRLRVTDVLVIAASITIAYFIRFGDSPGEIFGTVNAYWPISIGIGVVWLCAMSLFKTRDGRVIGVGVGEYRRVAAATAFAFGFIAVVVVIAKIDISRGYFVLAFPVGVVALVVTRWSWRQWLSQQRVRGHYLSRALVVGSNKDVRYVVDQIRKSSGASYNVLGAVLETKKTRRPQVECTDGSVPVVADMTAIATAAANLAIDTVIVASPPRGDREFVKKLSWSLEGTSTDLVLASRLTDVAGPRIHFRPVDGLPLIHVEIPHFDGPKHTLKRAFDLTAAALALLILAPLMGVIALLVHREGPGPVIFRQRRVGRDGATFSMLKFRSMVENAESMLPQLGEGSDGNGVLFKLHDDPRITRVGRVLRKYSLDELPQLWNIFVGDMSLVGPRPPLESEVAEYEDHVRRRLYIKPGLTGLWQVSGRSDLSWEDSVRLDLYYIENWSLTGDVVLLWRTAKIVVRPVGAY